MRRGVPVISFFKLLIFAIRLLLAAPDVVAVLQKLLQLVALAKQRELSAEGIYPIADRLLNRFGFDLPIPEPPAEEAAKVALLQSELGVTE